MSVNGLQTMQSDLPEGWALTCMDTAGIWSTGGTPSRKVPAYFGGEIPWVKSGDLNDGILTSTQEQLTMCGLQESPAKLVAAGSVSIALYGATIGKLGVLAMPAATNQACANCEVDERAFWRKYIFYYLMSQRQNLIDAGQGGAQPNLTNQIVRDWPLPVPPLAEQERIVAKLEEVLARVNNARERLARVPAILKRFRQSVLAAACSGRLTADWREHEEGSELEAVPQAFSGGFQDLPERPSGWTWNTIEQLAADLPHSIQSGPFGSHLLHSEFQERGILAIGIDNVHEGCFSLGRQHRISLKKYEELRKFAARPGDVLLTVMATVGRCCVIPDDIETAIITKHVYRITVDRARVEPHYLMLSLLGDPFVLSQVQEQIRGQTRPGINGQILKGLHVCTPSLSEQQEIIRCVDMLLGSADTIATRVMQATRRADKLTQSTLARTFRGELVPTEAELARAEGRSYESAAELLERIRHSRQSQDGARAVRTRSRRSG